MQTQDFVIESNGAVKGGSVSYQADLSTGDVSYQAQIQVGFAFIKKTFPAQGKYKVDPEDLKSSKITKVGDTLAVGNVSFTALSVSPGRAQVGIHVFGQNMSGVAELDTSGEYIKLRSAKATANVLAMNLTVDIEPAADRARSWYGMFSEKLAGIANA